jgi:IS30 family transposase
VGLEILNDLRSVPAIPTPHHAWERRTNENTNRLIRQYLPKRNSMVHVTQYDCNAIAKRLNTQPGKRYDFDTPEERFHAA